MQSIYAICKCNLYMQFIYAIYICNQYMQSIYAIYIYICNLYMQYIYICNPYMLYIIYICNLYRQYIYIYAIYICKLYMLYMQSIYAIYIYMQSIYAFAIPNAENIHFPYVIMTFCNIECWKYTFSLWNIDILAPQMHAGRPAGGSPETVPTGTQQSAKNSINPCTKWGTLSGTL